MIPKILAKNKYIFKYFRLPISTKASQVINKIIKYIKLHEHLNPSLLDNK